MPPRNRPHYAGASSRITRANLSRLGPAFMVQPKVDGAYCHVHLGPTGCIQRISSRTGRDYGDANISGLVGQFVGWPGAVLIGELTAHTEAGNREAKTIGCRRVHLFDIAFGHSTQPLAHMSYSDRRDQLCSMQAQVEAHGPGPTWTQTPEGARDLRSGRFSPQTLTGTALTPIVPQMRPCDAGEMWAKVDAGELEGLVAVSLRAKLGARGSKRKCKATQTIDAVVVGVDTRAVSCIYAGQVFAVSRGKRDLKPGDQVEVALDGWYESSTTPRFARIIRRRADLC